MQKNKYADLDQVDKLFMVFNAAATGEHKRSLCESSRAAAVCAALLYDYSRDNIFARMPST